MTPSGLSRLEEEQQFTRELDGVRYLLVPHVTGVEGWVATGTLPQADGLMPPLENPTPFVAFLTTKGATVTGEQLKEFHAGTLLKDDAFLPHFLETFVFYGGRHSDVHLDDCAKQRLKDWNTIRVLMLAPDDHGLALRPGPYFGSHGTIWQAWRMYTDQNLTMTSTKWPSHTAAPFLPHSMADVVVPPRSYYHPQDPAKPLSGCRIAVKDVFDIEGFQTTLCNLAWAESRGSTKKTTAPSVQRLQDLGAIVVGKTRLNAMVVREETMECVEFLAPFNPRGDGYQTSSGSSSGSCAALGAYPWLDFAIGSDTNGSCRKPAHWNGCFAIRPTHGVLDVEGVASFCPEYDVPAFFGRDISRFRGFAEAWYGDSDKLEKTATDVNRILYPTDYLPTSNPEQMEVIDKFVKDLEESVGVKKTDINLAEEWRKSKKDTTGDADLPEYLRRAGTMPYYKDAIKLVKAWFEEYTEAYGKTPFIHRALRWRWEEADKLSDEERDEGWERVSEYKKWLLSNIITPGTVVVLPVEDSKPNYRDEPPPPFGLLSGFSPLYMSPIAGTPEVTAPVGELPYQSFITRREEHLPVSISLVSAPGTDLNLIDIVHNAFVTGKRPVALKTGRSMY